MKSIIRNLFPIVDTLKNYNKGFLKYDLFAGLTVASVLIPQAMAYAMLAGMPPIYGMYCGLVPLLIYAIFASSSKMSVGPVAISSILIFSGVSTIAQPGSQEYIELVLASGLIIGLIQALMGFFRLGFVVNFLSHAVILGFTSAAALIILFSQLKDALGFHIPNSKKILVTLGYALENIGQTNRISLLITVITVVVIIGLKKIKKSIPGPLIVVTISIIVSYQLDLKQFHVDVVGQIPKGLPNFETISMTFEQLRLLVPTILTVSLIGIVESMGIAKAMEAKYNDHRVLANTELKAIGFAKIIGAFFQSFPSSGSFTRSAINGDAGAKTTVSSLVTVAVMLLTLLFLTGVFYYLPKSVLAGIILISVFGLFDITRVEYIWKVRKTDFAMMTITFICTMVLGIELGVLVGVLFSIITILYKISRPNIVTLGKLPNSDSYKDISRFPEAEENSEIVIFRFENQLFFANASIFRDKVLEYIITKPSMKYLLLDAKLIHDIDSHGTHILKEVDELLKTKGIELHLCGAIGSVRDILFKAKLLGELDMHHLSVSDAVLRINDPDQQKERNHRATQRNVRN